MAAQITLPAYLKDEFRKLHLTCRIEDKLSFLDAACMKKLMDCFDNPTNELFKQLWQVFLDHHRAAIFANDVDEPPHTKEHFLSIFHTPGMNLDLYQQTLSFFTNPLMANHSIQPGDDCIINVGTYFHTFKVMPHPAMDDKALLNEQLSWLVDDNDNDCLIAKIDAYLIKHYEDYRGMYCVYSGNRSVHLHTAWNIGHLRKAISPRHRVKDNYLRPGLMHCWGTLAREIAKIIKWYRDIDVRFDPVLDMPDMYRRLSWGMRRVDEEGEFFDIGEKIPQVELYAKTRKPHLIYMSEGRLHNAPIFKKCNHEAESRTLSFDELLKQFDIWATIVEKTTESPHVKPL